MPLEFTFQAEIWLYEGPAAWYFVTVPKPVSARINSLAASLRKPYGSVRVTAITGNTRWNTSLFPDTKRAAYLLPIKAAIRAKEKIRDGDTIEVSLLLELGDEV